MVANPPPYMERMMQKAVTNSGIDADVAESRNREVQQNAEQEEHHVGVAPADEIRGAGPEKSADHVEQTDQTDEARRRRSAVTRPGNIS